jgi:WAS protein family homolog 1
LKTSKRSIKCFSSAKYPISHPPKFSSTFHDFTADHFIPKYNVHNLPSENIESKRYSDKLQFFHLKQDRQQAAAKPNIVFNATSISSLITFINNENILSEPSVTVRKPQDTMPLNETIEREGNDFSRFATLIKSKQDESFHYFPNMNQAPEIELPIGLELPGIADDIQFSSTVQELIAPSLAKMNIVNELPNVADLEAESNRKLVQDNSSKANEKDSTDLPSLPKAVESVKVSTTTTAIVPPPPPPIPASFIPPPPPIQSNLSDKKPEPKEPQPADARSSLMQAIRNAGGKSKLRSAPAADEQAPTTTKKQAVAPPADLMSDLHAKLAMRRRGIAGTKEAKKEKASLIEKVRSNIPHLQDTSDNESSNSDTEWD